MMTQGDTIFSIFESQASDERLFNLQNEWVLFDRRGSSNGTVPREFAQRTFKTHMSRAYVLPDSRVYLLIETDDASWEIWDGFRLSVTEDVQVSRVGVVTPDRVEIKPSDRTNLQRVVLRASTVVCTVQYLFNVFSVDKFRRGPLADVGPFVTDRIYV